MAVTKSSEAENSGKGKAEPKGRRGIIWMVVAALAILLAVVAQSLLTGSTIATIENTTSDNNAAAPEVYARDMVLLKLGGDVTDFVEDTWARMNHEVRYNALLCNIQFHIVKHFTEVGFKRAKLPLDLYQLLREKFDKQFNTESLSSHGRTEPPSSVVDCPNAPAWVDIGNLGNMVAERLKEQHEEWAGVKLRPTFVYGLRVYLNDSLLYRHVDRVETHVISSIVHIAHDTVDPWPLHISDNSGKNHAVSLREGEMLFYESAKLPHWRLPMNGRYYTSLFVHYVPVEWNLTIQDCDAKLPPAWSRNTFEHL